MTSLDTDAENEAVEARQVLSRAYELARNSPEAATRAEAACALASALALAGRDEQAEQLLQEAEALLPKEPQFALHRILCLMRGSEVAQDRGDGRVAVDRAQAGQRLLQESGFASALLRYRVSSRLAETYRADGRFRESAATFEEAFRRLAALGREDTERAGTILNNWALTVYSLGQPLEAERLFRRAVRVNGGTEPSASPMLLTNLARTLRDLHRLPEAADYAEQADAKARRLGNQVVIYQDLLLRASVYRMRGQLDRAAAMLREVEPRLKRMVPAGHIAFAAIVLEQALLDQARGDAAAALSAVDRAVALAEASPQRASYVSRFLLRRAELACQNGRLDQALADADAALREELQASAPGMPSSMIGQCHLVLGQVRRAQGRPDEAGAAFASAFQILRPALGERHPATRAAREQAACPTPDR